jgi:hypothetical protein
MEVYLSFFLSHGGLSNWICNMEDWRFMSERLRAILAHPSVSKAILDSSWAIILGHAHVMSTLLIPLIPDYTIRPIQN